MGELKRLRASRTKKAGEVITYEIPWWHYIGRTWRRGERYIVATFVRPTAPNGFEYECTVAGQTSIREPSWPTTVGATKVDGSVTWACRAIGNNALDVIGTSVWPVVQGITIANEQTDAVKQLTSARISGGTIGQTYEIENEITTASGDEYIFTLELKII